MGDWVLVGAKVQPAVRDWLAEFALERRTSVSEVLRLAISEYLINHAKSAGEVEVAETIRRGRMEAMRLMIPKSDYDILQFPSRVKKYVYAIRDSSERDGFLTMALYDKLVGLVGKEMKAIAGNPHEEYLAEMLNKIVGGLREEQKKLATRLEEM